MKEPQKAIVGAVERAADLRGDVGRSQEAMPSELADNLSVIIGEAEGGRFRRTAEPWPTGRGDKRLRVHAYNYIGADRSARPAVSWGKRSAITTPRRESGYTLINYLSRRAG